MAQENGTFAPLPESIKGFEDGVHKFVQGVFDEKVFDEIIEQANKPKITENELNENFAKKEFQTLWKYINHKYAYTVSFDSEELIQKAIKSIDEQMYVTELTYVRTIGSQNKDSFDLRKEDQNDDFARYGRIERPIRPRRENCARHKSNKKDSGENFARHQT